jgi:hypothetical protein
LVLLINIYTLSSTNLKIRAKQFLPGSEGVAGEKEGAREKGECGGKRGEMTHTLCVHMNKRNFKIHRL